jgi:hypothetical protein
MGLLLLIFVIADEMESYYALLALGLIGWGVYDLRKELRDRSKKGDVKKMEKEREEIEKKMKEGEK